MILNRAVIRDPAVGDIEGATILVPEGWKLEAGFVWMPLLSMQANLMARLTDPTSGASVETLPAHQYNWPTQDLGLPIQPGSNWNGSILLPPPPDPATFVRDILSSQGLPHLRGARLVGGQDLPPAPAPAGFAVRSTRLRYQFDGWEEDVALSLTFAPLNGWTAMWWSSGTSMRAPAGRLDAARPALAAAIQSLRITLPWHARLEEVRQVFAQGRLRDQQDFARFHRQVTEYRAEIEERHRQAWEEKAAAQDRQNFAMREILGGLETYANPFEGRAVEVPAGYAAAWASDDGKVLLTHDVNLDPRPGSAARWARMDRRSP